MENKEKILASRRCAVSFQNSDKVVWPVNIEITPKHFLGVYSSWPFGNLKFYKMYLLISCGWKSYKIDYKKIKKIIKEKSFFFDTYKIEHKNKNLPKHILFSGFFMDKFFKDLRKKFKINIKIEEVKKLN